MLTSTPVSVIWKVNTTIFINRLLTVAFAGNTLAHHLTQQWRNLDYRCEELALSHGGTAATSSRSAPPTGLPQRSAIKHIIIKTPLSRHGWAVVLTLPPN